MARSFSRPISASHPRLISQMERLPLRALPQAQSQVPNVPFASRYSETGMTISGTVGRVDVRCDGTTLRLFGGPAGQIPSSGVAITSGIVQLPNNVSLAAGAQGNNVVFGSPNSETG